MAFDQPLFAHAKYVQWSWPQLLGEGCFVVMFGGLYIEMNLWSTTSDFLDSSVGGQQPCVKLILQHQELQIPF